MTTSKVEEREANYFAMCLLMPEEMLLADIKKAGGIDVTNDAAVKKLADRYKVPAVTMALRIGQLIRNGKIPDPPHPSAVPFKRKGE
jgi:Zn-dependent peptidase ImmA (M78 family)